MESHYVTIAELADYEFEQLICSSYPKRLIVKGWPSQGNLLFFFKVEVYGEVVGRFDNLIDALEAYNSIK